MRDNDDLPRFCREAQAQLPFLVSGELSGWPARVVRSHVKRCADCRAELARQEQLGNAFAEMRTAPPAPPAGLLEDLLARSHGRGIRERAAVPARGAVSGARPALSVAFLTVGAAASTGAGYAAYKGLRWALNKRR
ncbi:MAG TPA: zf-HC2 domain-containing protein [Mycobacteriales bacterium]|jgi:predicted anti-sigma-YlaC factor YlaD|nr:zf-HC2 domain-containing protein [Mycobacteriales bacterium]